MIKLTGDNNSHWVAYPSKSECSKQEQRDVSEPSVPKHVADAAPPTVVAPQLLPPLESKETSHLDKISNGDKEKAFRFLYQNCQNSIPL